MTLPTQPIAADPIADWLAPLLDADAINAAKARAVVEFMDCPKEREAELLAVIREPRQGSLL